MFSLRSAPTVFWEVLVVILKVLDFGLQRSEPCLFTLTTLERSCRLRSRKFLRFSSMLPFPPPSPSSSLSNAARHRRHSRCCRTLLHHHRWVGEAVFVCWCSSGGGGSSSSSSTLLALGGLCSFGRCAFMEVDAAVAVSSAEPDFFRLLPLGLASSAFLAAAPFLPAAAGLDS